jgi:hypothetical protein
VRTQKIAEENLRQLLRTRYSHSSSPRWDGASEFDVKRLQAMQKANASAHWTLDIAFADAAATMISSEFIDALQRFCS